MDWIRNDRLKTFACKTKMPSMHLTLTEKQTKMNVATRAAGIALASLMFTGGLPDRRPSEGRDPVTPETEPLVAGSPG